MPYFTYAEAVDAVQGINRMRSLLRGHAEDIAADADDEPEYFASQRAIAQRHIDAHLRRGGYEAPLDESGAGIADEALKKAGIGITIDLITQTDSSRETWVDKFAKWAWAYVKSIADGDQTVIGGVRTADSGLALASSTYNEVPQFELGDPYSDVNSVLPPLGNMPWRR